MPGAPPKSGLQSRARSRARVNPQFSPRQRRLSGVRCADTGAPHVAAFAAPPDHARARSCFPRSGSQGKKRRACAVKTYPSFMARVRPLCDAIKPFPGAVWNHLLDGRRAHERGELAAYGIGGALSGAALGAVVGVTLLGGALFGAAAGVVLANAIVDRPYRVAPDPAVAARRLALRKLSPRGGPGIHMGRAGASILIPLESLSTGLLALGPTGTGKTRNLIGPSLRALAREDLGALILDRTGNLPVEDIATAIIDPRAADGAGWNPCGEGAQAFSEALTFGSEAPQFFRTQGASAVKATVAAYERVVGQAPTPAEVGATLTDRRRLRELRDRYADEHGQPSPGLQRLADLTDRDREERLAGILQRLEALTEGALGELTARSRKRQVSVRAAAERECRIALRLTAADGDAGNTLVRAALSVYAEAVLSAPERPLSTCLVADEAAAILTGGLERFPNQARQHGGATLLAVQSLGQLTAHGEPFAQAMLAGCRSLVAIGALSGSDAQRLSTERFPSRECEELRRSVAVTPTRFGPLQVGQHVGTTYSVVRCERPMVAAYDLQRSRVAFAQVAIGRDTLAPIEVEL